MIMRAKNYNLFSFFEPLIIVVFWFVLFMSPVFFSYSEYGLNWNHIFRVWITFIPYLILFLLNRFVLLPYLFFKNRRLLFLGSVLLLILILAIGESQFRGKVFNHPGQAERVEHMPPPSQNFAGPPPGPRQNPPLQRPPKELPPFIGFMVISVLIVGFDTGLRLSVKWVRSEQVQANIEKENIQTQLGFLRNQVSPHFFMNTLNNIHALIDYNSDVAKESIIRLSNLMRHLLYDSEAEKIPIKKEIDFISNYVDLMRLRYTDKIKIDLNLPSNLPDRSIPPLLFTSFVENAFKHGISYQNSMFIGISFFYRDKYLHFQVRNSYARSGTSSHSGIGIANSRKRLDLLYGDRYTLDIQDKENEFFVHLKIPV